MIILGYLAAVLIGISLGLIGGGGSILTVPVLVYLMGVPPWLATTYSLFIVGFSSLAGCLRTRQDIHLKTVALFGSASIISVLFTRRLLLPLVPGYLFRISGLVVTKDIFLMVLFALLMIMAAFSMIGGRQMLPDEPFREKHPLLLFLQGLVVGFVTGMLGAGGGFLIIPALVLFSRLPMKKAVASSLCIIAVNSLIGFFGGGEHASMDWLLLLVFTLIAILGIFAGTALSKNIPGYKLKKGFGWFVLAMGLFILIKEIFLG